MCSSDLSTYEFPDYIKHPDKITDSQRIILNPSHVFISPIAESGQAAPELMARQPMGQDSRRRYKLYQQPHAGMDAFAPGNYGIHLATHVNRPEFRTYTYLLDQPHGHNTRQDENLRKRSRRRQHNYRFEPNADVAHNNLDVAGYYSYDNMDEVMSNSVLVNPFQGPLQCCFCTDLLYQEGMRTALFHLGKNHRSILKYKLTCPACFNVTILEPAEFIAHWEEVHASSILFIAVLSETHVAQRYQMGVAVYNFIMVNMVMAEPVEIKDQLTEYGAISTDDDDRILASILALRKANMPPAFADQLQAVRLKAQEERREEKKLADQIRRNQSIVRSHTMSADEYYGKQHQETRTVQIGRAHV